MNTENINQDQDALHITSLVHVALAQNTLSGLAEVLKQLAQSLNAYGCILWQVAPGADLGAHPNGFLFVLAQWFPDSYGSTVYEMPLRFSATGAAVLKQSAITVHDVWNDERVYRNDPFLRQAEIKAMCSLPIDFPDGTKGALNVYRKTPGSFNTSELLKAKQLSSLIPDLYQAIRDKVSLALIQAVDNVLQAAELTARDWPLPKPEIRKIIRTICILVRDSFSSLETTVFLKDRLTGPDRFELIETTWESGYGKRFYEKPADQGITGWVLKHRKPVHIFDLARINQSRKIIESEYPGLEWKDSLQIEPVARSFLNVGTHENLPPLSFMASPIMMGDSLLGVIRCAVARKEPRYFAERELKLLMLVATRVGQYWHNWLSRRDVLKENKSWGALIGSLGELNDFVQSELSKEEPDEHKIFAEALRVTSSVIRGAEITDIRMFDAETQQLYFVETHGRLWSEGKEHEITQRKSRRFPIGDGPPTSAGAYVFQTGITRFIPDTSGDPYYSETFATVASMIVAPIKIKGEIFGVLDIRTTGKSRFPRNACGMAEVLGQQLGLYHYLLTTIRNLQKAQADLGENVENLSRIRTEQAQTFEDLKHQLYGPISQAHWRIQDLLRNQTLIGQSRLDDEAAGESLERSLLAIRGLCAKAHRAVTTTGLFAELSGGKKLQTSPKRLQADAVVKMIIESALDNQLMINPDRHITFHVDRQSFGVLQFHKVDADYELLTQAIMNLLDNAFKYSLKNTTVQIYAGMTHRTGRFQITISNTGLPIRLHEIPLCINRGWRSESAKWVTGEGSGIGLWIVDNIMRAQNGQLIITPTTAEGLTEIRLVFAASQG